ncbi:MAG: FtsX-like permease family protein [Elusimicrobia bacterium]|nr:FtsX-like permease family protein [Elusimicrobiota bacterium]
MKLIIMLSLRNLFRQKRRNIFLGIAMAMGVTILVIANSFSHGISDIMFNKIMRWVTGQVTVRFNERGRVSRELFRDKDRIMAIIKSEPGVVEADAGVGMFMRAIGNGKSDNVILVGVNTTQSISEKTRKEVEESFRLIDGTWKDLENSAIENPVIVSEEKARYLNVKRNDIIRVRFRNMFSQDQAARLTIVGIMKNDNIFMQPVIFLELDKAKELLAYRPYETGSISIILKDPQKNASALADRIHARLKPGLAVIYASVKNKNKKQYVTILGYKSDDETKKKLSGMLKLTGGTIEAAMKKDGVIVARSVASALGVSAGDIINVSYERKFESTNAELNYDISAVCESIEGLDGNIILMNDEKFYDTYYENLPKDYTLYSSAIVPEENNPCYQLLAPEWILLKRTSNTDEAIEKYRELGRKKWKGTVVDVATMYETASDILKLEGVLKLITLSAVMVLFFIIVLGVVNTLRMTIRERTREIGTIRAIGMQRNDVRNTFILETFFLTLFASITGTLIGFGGIWFLTRITINMQDNPLGMLLVNGHLYFLPTVAGIAGNVLLIVAIAVVTAYFPARRAANLSPAKALRHFE